MSRFIRLSKQQGLYSVLIASIQIELFLPDTSSLKEKRFILKSMKTRIGNKFNVSVAEIDYLDKWQRSCLGIACVANSRTFLDQVYTKIMNLILQEDRVEVTDQLFEII